MPNNGQMAMLPVCLSQLSIKTRIETLTKERMKGKNDMFESAIH